MILSCGARTPAPRRRHAQARSWSIWREAPAPTEAIFLSKIEIYSSTPTFAKSSGDLITSDLESALNKRVCQPV